MNNSYILQSGEKGAERLATVQNLYGKESQFFLQKSGLKKGMTVIDIGCGTGLMTKWLAEQVGKTVPTPVLTPFAPTMLNTVVTGPVAGT